MRVLSVEVLNALAAGALVSRDFMTITARDRTTGNPVIEGFWSGLGDVSASVINPETDLSEVRDFTGVGTLISLDPIPLVSDLTVQTVVARFSQVHDKVNDLIRLYDVSRAKVEVFRGLYDPEIRFLVAPAEPRLNGFLDDLPIETPKAGDDEQIKGKIKSHTFELGRSNPEMRSHESQLLRSPTDNFFENAATAHLWEIFWGKVSGVVST